MPESFGLLPSLSKVKLKILVKGRGEAEGELFRHLAPHTFSELSHLMPLEGRPNRFEDRFVYLTTKAKIGAEKSRKIFKRAEIAFLPLNGSVCFFLKDCTSARSMNPIGNVLSGLELIENAEPGDVIRLELVQERAGEQT